MSGLLAAALGKVTSLACAGWLVHVASSQGGDSELAEPLVATISAAGEILADLLSKDENILAAQVRTAQAALVDLNRSLPASDATHDELVAAAIEEFERVFAGAAPSTREMAKLAFDSNEIPLLVVGRMRTKSVLFTNDPAALEIADTIFRTAWETVRTNQKLHSDAMPQVLIRLLESQRELHLSVQQILTTLEPDATVSEPRVSLGPEKPEFQISRVIPNWKRLYIESIWGVLPSESNSSLVSQLATSRTAAMDDLPSCADALITLRSVIPRLVERTWLSDLFAHRISIGYLEVSFEGRVTFRNAGTMAAEVELLNYSEEQVGDERWASLVADAVGADSRFSKMLRKALLVSVESRDPIVAVPGKGSKSVACKVVLRLVGDWRRLVGLSGENAYETIDLPQREALLGIVGGALLPVYLTQGPRVRFTYREDGVRKASTLHTATSWPSPIPPDLKDDRPFERFDVTQWLHAWDQVTDEVDRFIRKAFPHYLKTKSWPMPSELPPDP
ncbi:hypothetical protein I6F15_07250 [Bradyrhizobium sp. BRP14]|nr:hypothetical protein [Bradyrhizobium sp. BRP14]